jgi:cytochrome b561
MNDTPYGYGLISKIFHWLLALLVIGNLAVGFFLEDIPGDLRGMVMGNHKSFGILAGLLMLVRMVWRLQQGFPKLPDAIPARERQLARLGHMAFYPLIILMPIFGWLMSSAAGYPTGFFGLFNLPDLIAPDKGLREIFGALHTACGYGILALLVVHVGAALYHHYYQGHKLLRRML